MRTAKKKLYDDLYYGFEQWVYRQYRAYYARRRARRIKVDPEFYEAYKTTIRPYWERFDLKAKRFWFQNQYMITHSTDPRCVPRGIWFNYMIPHFNDPYYDRQLSNKNLHNLIFPHIKRPETIFKRMSMSYYNDDLSPITWEEALARCAQEGQFIAKPTTDTFEGYGIHCFTGGNLDEAKDVLSRYNRQEDYIVQRFVSQHPDLATLNATSVNTVRLMTLVLNGKAHILSSILRVGADGNQVDNVSQGGYQCTIRPDGTLEKMAFTHVDKVGTYTDQTASGVKFEGFQVPSWDKLCQTAIDLALRLPYMKLIGWDLAVDDQGDVVLIEFNSQPEQNEATCGPSFGDLTEDVLEEVFGRKK